jgi:Na+/phosphate symporter
MKLDIKNMLTTLHEIASDASEFISLLQTAFIYNTSKPLQDCKARAEEYGRESDHLSALLKEAASSDQGVTPYVSVPEHLLRIWKNLDRLSDLIDKKVGDKVLFSDKVVDETIYLLQRLIEILRPTADMILARNTYLRKYIQESVASIEITAAGYATLHENRLAAGESISAASSIYLSMLEAIKSIAWHTKEISVTLSRPK